jgi:hypothetical protein
LAALLFAALCWFWALMAAIGCRSISVIDDRALYAFEAAWK